jgi:hypothetical protein
MAIQNAGIKVKKKNMNLNITSDQVEKDGKQNPALCISQGR